MPTKTGELVAKAAKGDKNALAELYTTNFKSAFFPACGLLGNKQDALKAVINSFAKAFKNLSKLPKPDEFEDWIKQIAVKHCIDVIKKKKGTPLSAEKPGICRVEIDSSFEFLPIDVLNAKELTSETIKTVDSMPDTQRICVYLCYYNGYSPSAAAKLIPCTEDDVKWHLFAAREQIKNAVDAKTGNPTELSKMNGTSILSLVMELAKKELTVNSDTVKKSFFLACEKSGLFGEKKAPVVAAPEPVYAPMPAYQEPVYEPSYPPVYNTPMQSEEQIPQTKKKSSAPIIIVVIILLLLVAAGLAYWFIAKDNPDLPLPFASEEATTAADSDALNAGMTIGSMGAITRPEDGTSQTGYAMVKSNLKAKENDYPKLMDLVENVAWADRSFNPDSSTLQKDAYSLVLTANFWVSVYHIYYDESTYESIVGKDPNGKLDYGEYIILPADNVDWILVNVFETSPDHSISAHSYYYKDGYYYVGTGGAGDHYREASVIDAKENSDGSYTINVKCDVSVGRGDAPYKSNYYTVKAALREDSGVRYWTFNNMTLTKTVSHDETTSAPVTTTVPVTTTKPQTEPSTAAKAEGYMAAYNNYLKNYNGGEYPKNARFKLDYFNDDDIPELFVSGEMYHYAPVKILTYRNGEVVELCEYGVYGTVHYVERESIVVTGDIHRGYESGSIRKINDDGTEEILFKHYDNGGAVAPDSGELFYEINGERVSEEEYYKAVEENMSLETTTFYDEIPLTTENIDKYCS